MGNTLKLEDLLKPDCVPDESAGGENWRILHGDTLKLVKGFQPGIFDAVITDPPYASGGTKQNERNRTTNQKYSSINPKKRYAKKTPPMICSILIGWKGFGRSVISRPPPRWERSS